MVVECVIKLRMISGKADWNVANRPGLTRNDNTMMIEWKSDWSRRMMKLARRYRKGKCLKFGL